MKKLFSLALAVALIFTAFGFNSVKSSASTMLGDANNDNVIDCKDVLVLRKYVAELITSQDFNSDNADINDDQLVDIKDIYAIRKILINLPTTATTTTTAGIHRLQRYTFDQIEDSIYLTGRSTFSETTIVADQTASGFKFNAQSDGNLCINITASLQGYVDLIVDEDYNNILRESVQGGTQSVWFELNLDYGYHTFYIMKANEFQRNKYVFNWISVNGEKTGTAPEQKDLKIEFYGDSITSGYGNLCSNGTPSAWEAIYQDGCQTYAAFASYKLNADFAVAAAGGYGVITGYSSVNDTFDKFFWYKSVSGKTLWNISDYNADMIVVNYGTNDYTHYKDNIEVDLFKEKCQEILTTIHTANPDAPILWILGMNSVNKTSKVYTTIQSLADQLDYLDFLYISTAQKGGDSHPSVADHKIAGDTLVSYLKTNYSDIFKS